MDVRVMREISSKEFALEVDDCIAGEIYDMLVNLMCEFEKAGYVRELTPLEEAHIEVDTEEAAEDMKERVYEALVGLGLDVESDGSWF